MAIANLIEPDGVNLAALDNKLINTCFRRWASVLITSEATEENAVRFYNEQQAETTANIKKHAVVLKVDAGNNVSISAWEDFDLIDGTCTYNQNSKVFNVDYKYTADGKTYQMVGTFTSQDEDAGSN